MKKDFKRPRDPRLNILSIDNPKFFLKEKNTMDKYLAASFSERHKMLDLSQKNGMNGFPFGIKLNLLLTTQMATALPFPRFYVIKRA